MEMANQFEFIGKYSENRSAPKSKNKQNKVFNIKSIVSKIIAIFGLDKMLKKKLYVAKKNIRSCDVALFQGIQDTHLLKYAKRKGIKVGYMPHSPTIFADEYKMNCELSNDILDAEKYKKLFTDEHEFFSLSDYVFFPTNNAASEYTKSFGSLLSKKNVYYIKSGLDIEDDCKAINKIANDLKVKILFVGRYVKHKGYDIYCEAAELVLSKRNNVSFFSAGTGPMKSDSADVKDYGWRSDVIELIKNHDIVVIPNRVAYYDLLPLECAALGKPLVMTRVGGNIDQLRDLPDTIECVDAESNSLSKAIAEAIDRYEKNPKWGLSNKEPYEKCFTAEIFARRWDNVFKEIENLMH